jgi:hypothetical protein
MMSIFRFEAWKIVPSLPTVMVSSEGRVMVIPYQQRMPNGGVRSEGGEPHFGTWDSNRQRFNFIYKRKTYRLAKLVCEAFNGQKPFASAVCMHLDEDPANNRPSNLQWGTQKENLNAPGFLEYCKSRTGENNPNVKGRIA